jgi:hypothetical protein
MLPQALHKSLFNIKNSSYSGENGGEVWAWKWKEEKTMKGK